jgi:hypothetical protein
MHYCIRLNPSGHPENDAILFEGNETFNIIILFYNIFVTCPRVIPPCTNIMLLDFGDQIGTDAQ